MSTAADPISGDEERQLNDLLFGIRRSIRYHNRRRSFFDRFDKSVKILSLVTGSGAFLSTMGSHQLITMWFAAAVAVLSAISLVVGPAQAARLHEELAKRFSKLESEIIRVGPPDSTQLRGFMADRVTIESDEPPALRVLDTICHNELCQAFGYRDFYRVDPVQRFFANVIDLWPWRIKKESTPVNR
jgi:hypothetical protein